MTIQKRTTEDISFNPHTSSSSSCSLRVVALCGLASSWSLHQQYMLVDTSTTGSDVCQLLQHCNILQAPLLATLVLSAITPSTMHFSEVTLYQLTVARGILDLQKPATISVQEGINRVLQLARAWHRDILHKSVPFCNFPYFKGVISLISRE